MNDRIMRNRRAFSPRTGLPGGLVLLFALFLAGGCGSDVGFRRFEVGRADPLEVLDTAEEVVRTFYTRMHGGLSLTADRENLSLETGYIYWKPDEDFTDSTSRVTTRYEQPRRQKLCLSILPESDGVYIEMLATYEVLSISNPDSIETADDMWKFVKQDELVEDILYEEIIKQLMEKEILE